MPKKLRLNFDGTEYQTILDEVNARDRAYLEAHPEVQCYWREMVEYEFYPKFSGDYRKFKVCVTRVEPDVRMRVSVQAEIASKLEPLGYGAVPIAFKGLDYSDYLQTKHWKETRQRALTLAGNRCATCSTDKHLSVHHKTYARVGAELDEDLLVLCVSCHAKLGKTLP